MSMRHMTGAALMLLGIGVALPGRAGALPLVTAPAQAAGTGVLRVWDEDGYGRRCGFRYSWGYYDGIHRRRWTCWGGYGYGGGYGYRGGYRGRSNPPYAYDRYITERYRPRYYDDYYGRGSYGGGGGYGGGGYGGGGYGGGGYGRDYRGYDGPCRDC